MLKIDIETYSKTDLKKAGVYRYSEDPAFKVLLFGVSVDDSPVKVYDLARGEKLPTVILEGLLDTDTEKWAHNAQFERVCLSRYLWDLGLLPRGQYLNPKGWYCSMIWSVYLGFPASLRDVGVAFKLDEQKIVEGKELIKFFCTGKRNFPVDAPEKWEAFVKYNARDVEVEMAIMERLSAHPVPEHVWKEYWLDQEINDRGIAIDLPMVQQAIALDSEARQRLVDALQELTGLDNPRSVQQMQNWLKSQGMEMDSLGKKFVAEALKDAPEPLRTVLELRQQLAMSSVRKYEAMQNAVCRDGRLRGMFKFYGASKTGRFSGAIVQLQNLYRNSLPDLDLARELVKLGDYAAIDTLYGSVPEVLAECVRTAFIPAKGYKFIVADFSAIEARVLAWLAGEQWVLDVFQAGGDIYCETASRMFHVPVEKHGQNAELRQKGKQTILSCGYGGSVEALRRMGAIEAGMKEDELQPLVNAWRTANPKIVRLWWDVDKAVKDAIRGKTSQTHGLVFEYRGAILYITLPSKRQLTYVKPRIVKNRFGGESVSYIGVNTARQWTEVESYGAKFTENLVQSISRDLLCHSMEQLRNCRICAHVHDEIIIECKEDTQVETVCTVMALPPEWAEGLPLKADGYETKFYKKD